MNVDPSIPTIEGRLTVERALEILGRDAPYALAPVAVAEYEEIRLQLRPLFVRASRVHFETLEDRESAVVLFGPGILAKSDVRSASFSASAGFSVSIDGGGRRVDQITPSFQRYDAISDEAVLIRDALRKRGFGSTIYSPQVSGSAAGDAEAYRGGCLARSDLAIYHFAIASDVGEEVAGLRNRRALWYHNITPASFFKPYAPTFAALLDEGRDQLERLAGRFDALIADSEFNAGELAAFTDRPVDVVPFPMDFRRFDVMGQDLDSTSAHPRWLFVGRIAPNKGLVRLVRAFAAFTRVHPHAQLILAGKYVASDPYYVRLCREIVRAGVDGNVVLTGAVSDAQLVGLYAGSDIFVTLSEHEGFCAPLVEAMFFDLPIVASVSGAIPETLGPAGLMVEDEARPVEIAALADVVLSDAAVRGQLIEAQRRRRWDFLPERSSEHLSVALSRALALGAPRN